MAAPDLGTISPALRAIGYEGSIHTTNLLDILDRVNDQATRIDFGRIVARSVTDKGCKLATLVGDKLLGVAARHAVMESDINGILGYLQNDAVPIVRRGLVVALAYDDVTEGDAAVLVAGQSGKIGSAAATVADTVSAAAHAGGTGNGTITMDVTTPLLTNAQSGVYTAKCITAATNGGTFRVADPHGNVLGDVAVGATFANQVKFVIADGSTDFIVGDQFDITVAIDVGRAALGRSQWQSTVTAGGLGLLWVDM